MVYSREQADRVRKVLANQPDLSERQMFGGIAFLIAGNMAVGVHREDLIVRVNPLQTEELLKERGAKPFDLSGGRPLAGWLLVGPSGHRSEVAVRAWIARGVAYASSLPKKTPRKAGTKR